MISSGLCFFLAIFYPFLDPVGYNNPTLLLDQLSGARSLTHREKRRTVKSPKFYFHDVGMVNHLAKRGTIQPGSELFGKAFENWIFHEISTYNRYSEQFLDLSYWRLSSGIEVDFILGKGDIAIEVKGKEKINSHDLKGLLHFKREYPNVKQLILVSLERNTRKTDSGILILPFDKFFNRLWDGEFK